ncbi:MAG: hypothetical protein FWC34_00225, partial [Bacteroidetes bacterium]|nr:hypothetical protein [Bacteroidota bacterium]
MRKKKLSQNRVEQQKQQELQNLKKRKKELKKQKKEGKVSFGRNKIIRRKADTTIESIPYERLHKNGICELPNGKYSKTYGFPDISYRSAKDEDREKIFAAYVKFLNSLSADLSTQIVIANKRVDIKEVHDIVLAEGNAHITPLAKELKLEHEFNGIIQSALEKGDNTKRTQRYISIALDAPGMRNAKDRFVDIESHLAKKFKDISTDCKLQPLDGNELAQVLAGIFRENVEQAKFSARDFAEGKEKAFIAADGLEFKANHFMIGERFAKCLFLRGISSSVTDELIADLFSSDVEMQISINVSLMDISKVRRKISRVKTGLKAKQMEIQRSSAKKGVFIDITPQNILDTNEAADEMSDLIKNQKQNIFMFNMIILFFADTLEELKIKEL